MPDEAPTDLDALWQRLSAACRLRVESRTPAAAAAFPWRLRFGAGGDAVSNQLFGWNQPEPGFTWTEGGEALLDLPALDATTPLLLNVRIAPLVLGPVARQRVEVQLDRTTIAIWEVNREDHYFAVVFPDQLAAPRQLGFLCDRPSSPRSLGVGEDDRMLGLRFMELSFAPIAAQSF